MLTADTATGTIAPMTDDELWESLRSGDEQAFRALFERHHKAVYNVAFRHCASWVQAEDATQLAFTSVWRRATITPPLPGLRAGAVRAWLCALGRNEARNQVRSSNRRLRLHSMAAAQPRSGERDDTANWVEAEAAMQRINTVLGRVPDGQRAVIELVWAGCNLAETAAALDLPVGTVKSRLSRARKTLATTEVAALLGEEN